MNNLTIFFKNAWKWKCNLPEEDLSEMGKSKIGTFPDLEKIREMRILPEFQELEYLGNNRMIMATFRYNLLLTGHNFIEYSIVNQIKLRLDKYINNNDLESLIDVYNFVRIEYLRALSLGLTLSPIDDGEHAEKTKEK